MAGAKAYHKAPIMIAQDVVAKLEGSGCFCDVQAVNPGFINLKLDERFVADYLDEMETDEDLGLNKTDNPKTTHRLRRTERGKTASCRTSSFCNYW